MSKNKGNKDKYQKSSNKEIKPSQTDDEYIGLRIPEPKPVNEKTDHADTENQTKSNKKKKKSEYKDFRTKYKTEKCKFWEVTGECKFGENVKI